MNKFRIDGYLTLSNSGGIQIMLSETGEAIRYCYYGKVSNKWQQIKTNSKGEQYVIIKGRKYNLNQFMRYEK